MKLEIAVRTPDEATASGGSVKVEKLLKRSGDIVKAGERIALLRTG